MTPKAKDHCLEGWIWSPVTCPPSPQTVGIVLRSPAGLLSHRTTAQLLPRPQGEGRADLVLRRVRPGIWAGARKQGPKVE